MSFENSGSKEQPDMDPWLCGKCDGHFVYPVEWEELEGETRWQVTSRCPDCEHRETRVLSQAIVEKFDDELDRGTQTLVRNLRQAIHITMEAELELITDAFEKDLIGPDDIIYSHGETGRDR